MTFGRSFELSCCDCGATSIVGEGRVRDEYETAAEFGSLRMVSVECPRCGDRSTLQVNSPPPRAVKPKEEEGAP